MLPKEQRIGRFFVAVWCIGATYLFFNWPGARQLPLGICFSILTAYYVGAGVLMAWITGRLYRQHEIRKWRFDVVTIMLVMALFALPFACGSGIAEVMLRYEHERIDLVELNQANRTSPRTILTFVAFFMLLPVFLATEAIVVWLGDATFRAGANQGES